MIRATIPIGLRFAILTRDKNTCQYCGAHIPSSIISWRDGVDTNVYLVLFQGCWWHLAPRSILVGSDH
jgi:hypothetical protein